MERHAAIYVPGNCAYGIACVRPTAGKGRSHTSSEGNTLQHRYLHLHLPACIAVVNNFTVIRLCSRTHPHQTQSIKYFILKLQLEISLHSYEDGIN
ncbi:hypothetical protein BH10BAC2_BH10BAC2_02060 [soil metagenome]